MRSTRRCALRPQGIDIGARDAPPFEPAHRKFFHMHASPASPDALAQEFVRFAIEADVLRFGEFKTKAGRLSPYFFNAGGFDDGAKLGRLAAFYARRLLDSGLQFDMLFGPAYKGIVLAAAVAVELARLGRNVPFAYNRKEEKDHGEGGRMVGAPLAGRVVVIDDVISAGTSVRESAAWIRQAGATPAALAIALDRQECAAEGGVDKPYSAVQYVVAELAMPVVAVATLADLLEYLCAAGAGALAAQAGRVAAYRDRYGV
jgi:orotate phosphoribosyltransferase